MRPIPGSGSVARYAEAVGSEFDTREPASTRRHREHRRRGAKVLTTRAEKSDGLRRIVQFLNDVAALHDAATRAAIRNEPDTVGDRRWDALLTRIAGIVARHAGPAGPPRWASSPGRFLRRF